MNRGKIPPHLKEPLQRLGQHEVGHWISAKILGFRTGPITAKVIDYQGSYEGGSEITLYYKCEIEKDIVEYIEKRMIILYSGVLGEWLEKGTIDTEKACESLKTTAKQDSTKITELCNLLNCIVNKGETDYGSMEKKANELSDILWHRAHDLIVESEEVIYGLGSRVAQEIKEIGIEYKLTDEEIVKLPAIEAYLQSITQ